MRPCRPDTARWGPPAGPGLAAPTRPPCPPPRRLIFVSNHLPLKVSKGTAGWNFEWDEDALIAQAREGIPEEMEALYVGCLPVEVEHNEQDVSWLGRCGSGAAVRRRCSGTRRGCGLWNGGCKTGGGGPPRSQARVAAREAAWLR